MTAQKDRNKSEDSVTPNHSDFSIEHILNRAGSSTGTSNINSTSNFTEIYARESALTLDTYNWLQCTRYCPPKVPRTQKRCGPHKRQLGRHPRIPFTSHQLSVLEEKFKQSPYLSSEEVIMLARQLQLADVRVKIWFQNRRARERREKLQNTDRDSEDKNKQSSSASSTDSNSTDNNPVPLVTNFFSPQKVEPSNLVEYLTPIKTQFNFTNMR